MKDAFTKAWQNAVVWKLAIAKCILFSLVTLGTALQTACVSIDYTAMHPWEKFLLWTGVFVLWGNQMLAFLEKTGSTLAQGKPPFSGNTEILSKQPENG